MTQPSFRKCITISKTNKTTFLVKNIYLYSTLYLIKCNLLLNYCRFFFSHVNITKQVLVGQIYSLRTFWQVNMKTCMQVD